MYKYVGGILVVVMVVFVTVEGKKTTGKFTPEFMEMLQTVLTHLKIDKSDLSKMAAGAQPSVETEVAVASSTTSTHAPTVAPMANTGESYCDKQSPATFQSKHKLKSSKHNKRNSTSIADK